MSKMNNVLTLLDIEGGWWQIAGEQNLDTTKDQRFSQQRC